MRLNTLNAICAFVNVPGLHFPPPCRRSPRLSSAADQCEFAQVRWYTSRPASRVASRPFIDPDALGAIARSSPTHQILGRREASARHVFLTQTAIVIDSFSRLRSTRI